MKNIRNIAIIAHVDHGKTTLVDKMIHAAHLFKEHEMTGELIMDSNDLERERGITILAKNVAIQYKGVKINVIDTPGHADFGGEVERVLNMADGVLLLVDAFEGPMPQTRFVLQKALEMGKKAIVVINKVDKPNCNPDWAHEAVFDLMCSLDATEEQLDFPVVYGSAKQGWMGHDWKTPTEDITVLLDDIVKHVPEPEVGDGTVQMLVTSLDFSNYIGRIAVGRLMRGKLTANQMVSLVKKDGTVQKHRIKQLFIFAGLAKKEIDSVEAGDICAVVGVDGFEIGDTIADYENPEGLDPIAVDEPTMSMLFTINDSPFFGQEGKFVTSRHVRERLERELEKNLAMRMEETNSADSFMIFGRGVLHLSILIETMRREGYELQIGQPKVIVREINGVKNEPMEELTIDVPEAFSGKCIEQITRRKGVMKSMEPRNDRFILRFEIPSRGIIGLRSNILTSTQGEAIMTHRFLNYEPWKGELSGRQNGSLIVMETGTAIAYSLDNLQDRGTFFIEPGEEVYEGQVIGENNRPTDLVINVTKTKKLTNMRASGSDDKASITPPRRFTLEEALEYIQEDEYVEVTPKNIRLRKIYLKDFERKKAQKVEVMA
ncbi:MAG: translational GTPase TypA [Saprospiraceae bacterium]|nr:translational GTPase TypA [Saprospiraceae bacterium]